MERVGFSGGFVTFVGRRFGALDGDEEVAKVIVGGGPGDARGRVSY